MTQRLRVVSRHNKLQRPRDTASELALQRQHVAELTVVAIRPELGAGSGIKELRRHANARCAFAHASLHDVGGPELLANGVQVSGLPPEPERRRAADYLE